jgi:hypothetical protein
MGSTDINAHIGIAILNSEWAKKDGDPVGEWVVSSRFESYTVNSDAEISWSGRNLSPEDGWCSYASGTLFVRSSSNDDPFYPRVEIREDVERVKTSSYLYLNGFHLNLSGQVSGIYHMVFPAWCSIKKVEYLSDTSNIGAVYPNIFNGRVLVTWLYRRSIQLKIRFDAILYERRIKELNRAHVYKTVTRQLKPNPWIKKISDGASLQNVIDTLPDVMKFFGL